MPILVSRDVQSSKRIATWSVGFRIYPTSASAGQGVGLSLILNRHIEKSVTTFRVCSHSSNATYLEKYLRLISSGQQLPRYHPLWLEASE